MNRIYCKYFKLILNLILKYENYNIILMKKPTIEYKSRLQITLNSRVMESQLEF